MDIFSGFPRFLQTSYGITRLAMSSLFPSTPHPIHHLLFILYSEGMEQGDHREGLQEMTYKKLFGQSN